MTTIRTEQPADQAAIFDIHQWAFAGNAEAELVDALRDAGEVAISLVAEQEGKIVGHILFSKLKAPMRTLSLAPIGILPDYQKQGIGSALIQAGLAQARNEDWEAVFVLGDPTYYTRFGFAVDAANGYDCPYTGEYFMAYFLTSNPVPATGKITYPTPFQALE